MMTVKGGFGRQEALSELQPLPLLSGTPAFPSQCPIGRGGDFSSLTGSALSAGGIPPIPTLAAFELLLGSRPTQDNI